MPCIGNTGDLVPEVEKAIKEGDLVTAAVLSSNRNFEARVHPSIRANYLASPPLVIAFALAGTVDIDFEKQALGKDKEGKDVFLKDIWPSRKEVSSVSAKCVKPEMFTEVYNNISAGYEEWQTLDVAASE